MYKKLGRVFVANGEAPWMQNFAYVPTPWLRNKHTLRIFCSFMDASGRGRLGFVDVSPEDPLQILEVSKTPLLDLNSFGAWSKDGISPTCVFEKNGSLYMVVMCWRRYDDLPYRVTTALAVSHDHGASFSPASELPILPLTPEEPDLRSAAFIESNGDEFQMHYVVSNGWENLTHKKVPLTEIRKVHSSDLFRWPTRGEIEVRPGDQSIGLARPWVFENAGLRELWLGERSQDNRYRLAYAIADPSNEWGPLQYPDLGPASEWDAEMQAAPAIIRVNRVNYLFYNGNGFGKTGFGVACDTECRDAP